MIRVAFASSDNEHVDMHFGAAERLVVFDIARNRADYVGTGDFLKVEMKGENRFIGRPEEEQQRDFTDLLRRIPFARTLYWRLFRHRSSLFTRLARLAGEPYAPTPEEVGAPSDRPPEDKVVAKLEFLQGCHAVYAVSIGASSVRRLMAAGIQPIIVEQGHTIEDLLNRVNVAIHRGGMAWVELALARAAGNAPTPAPAHHHEQVQVDPF